MDCSELKLTRLSYQEHEAQFLAPYAMKGLQSQGRQYPEDEHNLRTPFQRDRDRVIHSTAFRRLQYKTQVFVNHEGDHYRTRLTHTLETSQIARTIARALRLNEELVEAVSLAHDLGHGPFGHAGEWALRDMMKDSGGFEHNRHCLRIVEELEDSYPDFPGLNLSFETREGLKKHSGTLSESGSQRFRTLEADVVDLADEIAYNSHDLDDGLRADLIKDEDVRELGIWQDVKDEIEKKYAALTPFKKKRLAIRLMMNRQVQDVVETTAANIQGLGIETLTDVQRVKEPLVVFSKKISEQHFELKRFLHKNLYQHYCVIRMTDKAQRFVKALFEVYLEKPEQLPPYVSIRIKKDGLHRTICDYVAGMTDRFVLDEYKRFFEPYERVF